MPTEDTPEVIGVLLSGEHYRIGAGRLILRRPNDATQRVVHPQEITAVRRGGLEVILTRRAADPNVFVLPTVAAAKELEDALIRLSAPGRSARRPPLL